MKQPPEQFESNEQRLHQAPKTLIPNVLAQLGLEGKRKNVDGSLASVMKSLQAENWHTRLAALEVLNHQGRSVPIEPLLLALHDEDASVRASAVRLLGQRDDSVAMTGLEEALRDSDWHVRETAVFALGQHASPPIHLLVLAQNDEDNAVQKAATSILRDIQTESYIVRSLSPDEVLQTPFNTRFSKVYDYTNGLLRHIQGLEDRTVPSRYAQTNRNFTASEEGDGKGKQRPIIRALEVVVAVIVVLGLVGSWFTLTQSVHTSTQGHTGTTISNKGTLLYHQDEMTPAVYWTSNSKYVYIHDKQDTVLHFINVATKHVTTIANPDMVAQATTGKLAMLTPDGLSVCTVDNTGSTLHVQVQSVLTSKIVFDASYPKITSTSTGIISQWSHDGTRIALSSDNGIITIANVTSTQPLVVLKGIHTPTKTLEWSQDDRQLLTTTADGVMQAWSTTTGQRLFVVTVRSDTVGPYLQAFSPDRKHIAIVPNEQSIQILDAATGKVMLTYSDAMSSQSAYYQWIDSTHILSNNEVGTLNTQHMQVWDVITGRVTLDIPLPSTGASTNYANSKYVVTPALNALAFQVWDAVTGRRVATHVSSSIYVSFGSSPDEKYFTTTTGGSDNKIDMWSATTGKTVATYYGSDNSVVSAQWSPDGKYLLSLSTNGRTNPVGATLDLWQIPS